MEVFDLKIEDVIPYENNPRVNDHAIEPVKNSIHEFGFRVPILVDNNNIVVAGHTRILAAKELGMRAVPAIRIEDLSEEQVKAFRLADNKVAEYALWDNQRLAEEIGEIATFDMSELFGFFDEQRFCNFDSIMEQPNDIDAFFVDDKLNEPESESEIIVIVLPIDEAECDLLIKFLEKNDLHYRRDNLKKGNEPG